MDHPLKEFYRDIYRQYDLVNRIFTFGRDRFWRKKAADVCLMDQPDRILDVCTGTGDFILEIAARSEVQSELVGYDFSEEMLNLARAKASGSNKLINFIEGDVADMPFPDNYFAAAGIAFGIRNLVFENSKADRHLAEIYRVLKPGGRFVILESSKPSNILWRFINGAYLQFILPYLGGIISGNLKAYKYLARSSKNYYTITEAEKILEKVNFNVVEHKSLFLGSVMLVVVQKKI